VGEVEVEDNILQECLHMDSSRVWVSFKDKPTQGWDFGVSGSSPVPLSNTSSEIPHLHLIHDIDLWGSNEGTP
jgi:hypothetical protein